VNPDTTELLQLLDTYGGELYALLTRLTLGAGVADDLLQELFLKLGGSPRFKDAANRKGYVFRTAINLALDWRRSRRALERLETEPATDAAEPILRLIRTEELSQILDAMQELPALYREVLVLRYLQHEEYPQIASQFGKTEHQVRALCHKGLEELRVAFSANGKRNEV
jgi:RNA polymerase sigma-70 factor (ECF subfamily)